MEKTMSGEERIRRAEEIYYNRKNQMTRTTMARVNVGSGVKESKLLKRMIIQILVCLLIYFIFYIMKNGNYLFSEEINEKIKAVLSYDMNLQEQYKKVTEFINSNNENTEKNTETVNELIEAQMEELVNEGGAIEESTLITESTEVLPVEEASSMSQTQIDAQEIKSKYSLIKPADGTITSRFGLRAPTTQTVPKYHTGIDIAANTGTVFIASMEGTVILVSSQGDYGKHVKILKDDVMTLYAHCNDIYVKEGDVITQGQAIGEVGATGNVTGSHLHFEVRKQERLVNPDDLIEFN